MDNIKIILDKHMCSGCGACTVICPKNCIEMYEGKDVNYPIVKADKCINCKLCLSSCPGFSLLERFSNKTCKLNINEGILQCKLSCSKDNKIRLNSASGGFITTFLLHLLENKYVDGVICVKQSNTNPLLNMVYIARNKQELLLSMGSRYSPTSNCTILKKVLKNNERYAFVGKPCDIEGLNNLQNKIPALKENIAFKIGIMCHHTPTREALRRLMYAYKIDKDQVEKINFRGEGWPGFFRIVYKNKEELKLPYFTAWGKYLSQYINLRCEVCDDPLAEKADVTVGDPWGQEHSGEDKGYSALVIRDPKVIEIISKMYELNKIELNDINIDDINRYQVNLLKRKNNIKLIALAYKISFRFKFKLLDIYEACGYNIKSYLKLVKKIAHFKKQSFKDEYK